jgi:hypothetical protein
MKFKKLETIQEKMEKLYSDLNAGNVELKVAAGLTNIVGKYLKAEQLIIAREVMEKNK